MSIELREREDVMLCQKYKNYRQKIDISTAKSATITIVSHSLPVTRTIRLPGYKTNPLCMCLSYYIVYVYKSASHKLRDERWWIFSPFFVKKWLFTSGLTRWRF